jgi:hypothetical protein
MFLDTVVRKHSFNNNYILPQTTKYITMSIFLALDTSDNEEEVVSNKPPKVDGKVNKDSKNKETKSNEKSNKPIGNSTILRLYLLLLIVVKILSLLKGKNRNLLRFLK